MVSAPVACRARCTASVGDVAKSCAKVDQTLWPAGCDGSWSDTTSMPASTVASINSEHSPVVPPYPARRRAENLRPTEQQKIENAANPARTNMFAPKPIGGA